jgi:alpha-1,2-mannosyltransferase
VGDTQKLAVRTLFWGYAFVLALAVTAFYSGSPFADLAYYVQAAHRLRSGINPYENPYYIPFGPGAFELRYFYPPLLVMVLGFTDGCPFSTVSNIWTFGSVLAIAGGVWMLMRVGQENPRVVTTCGVLTAAVLFPPVLEGLYFGQVHAFVLCSVSAFVLFTMRRREALAGGMLGLAAALKMTPIVFSPLVVLARSKRGIAGLVLALLGSFLVCLDSGRGLTVVTDFFSALPVLTQGEFFWNLPENYSLAHLVAHAGNLDRDAARRIASLAVVALFGITFFTQWWKEGRVNEHLVSAVATLMILASPIVWFHHLSWTLVPIILELRSKGHVLGKVVVGMCTLVLGVSMPLNVYAHGIVGLSASSSRELTGLFLVIIPLMMLFVTSFLFYLTDRAGQSQVTES